MRDIYGKGTHTDAKGCIHDERTYIERGYIQERTCTERGHKRRGEATTQRREMGSGDTHGEEPARRGAYTERRQKGVT